MCNKRKFLVSNERFQLKYQLDKYLDRNLTALRTVWNKQYTRLLKTVEKRH